MNWKRYQNELMVLVSLLIMLSMYLYKHQSASSQYGQRNEAAQTVLEIKEAVALKKIWADKSISKKVKKLRAVVPNSKVKWSQTSRKVTATYKALKPSELNKLSSKILNTPVILDKFAVLKAGTVYNVELRFRW